MNAHALILAILNYQEASGYEIRKMSVEGPYSYFVDISYGSIYPTLARLEAEGFVVSRTAQDPGKPERKVYSITPAGRLEFIRALSQPPQNDKLKSEFLMVAMAAEYGSPASISRAIGERIAFLEEERAMIARHMDGCSHEGTRWVAGYGLHMIDAGLAYLKTNCEALMAIAGGANPVGKAAE